MDGNGFKSDDIFSESRLDNSFVEAQVPETPGYPVKDARLAYKTVGGGLFWLLLGSQIALYAAIFILAMINPAILETGWINIALSVIPIYLVGAPLFILAIRRTEPQRPKKQRISTGKLVLLLFSAIGCMYAFNYITSFFSAIIDYVFGIEIPNAVYDMLTGTSLPLALLSTLVIAPVLEELFFRKFICDRLAKYGEWQAILFSALAFSLFHMNFEQLFYAFALGCLFAIVYIKTGNILYTMAMHFAVNFVGSVPGIVVLKLGVLDTMEEFLQIADTGAVDVAIEFVKANAVDIIIFAAYTLFTTALMLAGVIILLTQIKKLLTSVGSSEMPKGERLKIMFSGKRTVAYIIICVALTVIAML